MVTTAVTVGAEHTGYVGPRFRPGLSSSDFTFAGGCVRGEVRSDQMQKRGASLGFSPAPCISARLVVLSALAVLQPATSKACPCLLWGPSLTSAPAYYFLQSR